MGGKMPASVVVFLRANKSAFDAAFKSVVSTVKNAASRMTEFSMQARYALMGMGGALAGLVYSASKAQLASAKLGAVLKSTGHAAGLSKGELSDFAASLEGVSTFSANAIKDAEALLATFKEIKGGVFKDATRTVLDMATVLGTDLKGSAIQLGKALNDPIKGVSALAEVGVSFNDQQKEQISVFVKSNDVASAQRIILAELASEMGGAAAASATTYSGKLIIAKNSLMMLGETLGGIVLPAIAAATTAMASGIAPIVGWADAHRNLTTAIVGTTAALMGAVVLAPQLVVVVGVIKKIIGASAGLFAALATPLGATVAVVAALVVGLIGVFMWMKQIAAQDKENEQQSQKYIAVLNKIGEAAKRAREASGDEEQKKALEDRVAAEEEALEYADQNKAKIHQANIARTLAEIELINKRGSATSKAAEDIEEAFKKELSAATLAAEQSGKSKAEQEKLAAAAKGYSEEQIKQLSIQTELARQREADAQKIKDAEEAEKQRHQDATTRIEAINDELDKLFGMSSEEIELFNLANLKTSLADIRDIGANMKDLVQTEADVGVNKLREDLQERLASEKAVTEERRAQAAASMLGRFESLDSLWGRIQSASMRAPAEAEANRLKQQREVKEVNDKILKVETDAAKTLLGIDKTLDLIHKSQGATFQP
jgi:hypothetical protein